MQGHSTPTDLFGDTPVKRCKICKQVFPLENFYAYRSNGKNRGRIYRHGWCKTCHARKTREWHCSEKGFAAHWRNNLRAKYGMTPEEYDAILASQSGVCAICRQPEKHPHKRTGKPRRLSVDHCHETGRVRGLLCSVCNVAVGFLRSDPERFHAAIEYLKNQDG